MRTPCYSASPRARKAYCCLGKKADCGERKGGKKRRESGYGERSWFCYRLLSFFFASFFCLARFLDFSFLFLFLFSTQSLWVFCLHKLFTFSPDHSLFISFFQLLSFVSSLCFLPSFHSSHFLSVYLLRPRSATSAPAPSRMLSISRVRVLFTVNKSSINLIIRSPPPPTRLEINSEAPRVMSRDC